jgi:hypothetical protein
VQLSQSQTSPLCGQTDVAWQFPNWIRLNLACRPITSYNDYNVCPICLFCLPQDLPGDVPSAIQRQEEKRMHTMLVKENTDRIPGKDSLRCDATYATSILQIQGACNPDTNLWYDWMKANDSTYFIYFICFIANGLPEVHAGLTRFIPILMRLSGLVSRLCRLQAACKL